MDREYVISLLTGTEPSDKKIQYGDHIDKELLEMLANAKHMLRIRSFALVKEEVPKDKRFYHIDFICSQCKKQTTEETNKTSLFALLSDFKNENKRICSCCEKKSKEEEKIQSFKRDQEYEEKIIKKTESYINGALNPSNSWNEKVNMDTKLSTILYDARCLNHETIRQHIVEMNYQDFLSTPYWQAVSLYAKKKANFKCSLCNSTNRLNTHHRTYDRHGMEHIERVAKEDLIVLCNECHEKFHNLD